MDKNHFKDLRNEKPLFNPFQIESSSTFDEQIPEKIDLV